MGSPIAHRIDALRHAAEPGVLETRRAGDAQNLDFVESERSLTLCEARSVRGSDSWRTVTLVKGLAVLRPSRGPGKGGRSHDRDRGL
jgi:hypothetical protein